MLVHIHRNTTGANTLTINTTRVINCGRCMSYVRGSQIWEQNDTSAILFITTWGQQLTVNLRGLMEEEKERKQPWQKLAISHVFMDRPDVELLKKTFFNLNFIKSFYIFDDNYTFRGLPPGREPLLVDRRQFYMVNMSCWSSDIPLRGQATSTNTSTSRPLPGRSWQRGPWTERRWAGTASWSSPRRWVSVIWSYNCILIGL